MFNEIESYYLKPGEIFYSEEPAMVRTVLGSCVSITMFVPRFKIGIISHCMLPTSQDAIHRGEDAMKYVDCALLYMNKKIINSGAEKRETEVKLFGGSNMFTIADADSGVGIKNVNSALNLIKKLGYGIVSSDTGGNFTRKLFFSFDTGKVYLRKISKIQGM
ncbi:chemotaxis protein CheD [Seleniivibrio woodruffii]|uniref:chemotaxis protein CheD n=1 Tax=Seleniivibrio woodruffii TaxID=1078050 RepID=UPI002409D549|nr:chemotaxis protein CheD [Seleniivibrio woodruffii]